ncbi:hypothetical protein ACYZTR_01830 [Pseudomonas sp. Hz4]
MDIEPTLHAEWIKLLPIIVGGTLTLLGGISGQILTQFLSARRERKKFLAAKLEDLARAVSAYSTWISEKRNTVLFKDETHDTPSPLDEAVLLQRLYFPELHGEILALMSASHPLLINIGEQAVARKENLQLWLTTLDNTAYDDGYKAHLKALSDTVKKCRVIAEDGLN